MPAIRLDDAERRRLLDRFLRYVKIDTRSDEDSETSPSTECQKDLARVLVEELKDLGCADVEMNEWGYVFATVPERLPGGHPEVPVIGLISHMDTYHGTPGENVKPQVLEAYAGGEVPLPGDPAKTLKPEDNPNLARCVGHTLITSDGTTLLGADDKAGIAEIMTAVDYLMAHPELPHGRVRIAFTTDEEVGRGTEHFDVAAFGAAYAYTLDGSDLGEIEDETFCGDSATVVVEGVEMHPGYAKDKMVNAVRVASALVDALDEAHLPETTSGRTSFLHPYQLSGDVTRVEIKVLVRAFTLEDLAEREGHLEAKIAEVGRRFPGAKIRLEVQESYRNMGFEISKDPKVLERALEAVRRQGLEPKRTAIRGGTDGARLSFEGLLTPNVWTGGQNFHSVQEWVSLDWMSQAAETAVQILSVWTESAAR